MKTIINIKNLTITLPHPGECERPRKEHYKSDKTYQPLTKETATDGVYIFTDSGNLWLPQFWGLSDETPHSVVVIKGDKKLSVSLKGSLSEIMMNDSEETQTSNIFSSEDNALDDWNGWNNTEELFMIGSPAAEYCKSLGNKWYIPALVELIFLQENKKLVDAALTVCGGEPLFYDFHWTSTRKEEYRNWVLEWNGGRRDFGDQSRNYRVRPVSAFL